MPPKISFRKNKKKEIKSKKPEIKVKQAKKLFSVSKDKETESILKYITKEHYFEKLPSGKGESKNAEMLKGELVNFLDDQHGELKEKISKLRKEGQEVSYLDLKLMSVPLKIKLFEANFTKKDFCKVIRLIKKIERGLKKFQK